METVSYTLERRDTKNFHGWVILECHDDWDDEIFSSTSLEEARAFLNDLTAQRSFHYQFLDVLHLILPLALFLEMW